MPKKQTKKPNSHDEAVKAVAEELKKDKWDVEANLENWKKPSEIGNHLPDILAKKGSLKRICEIATEEMFEGNKQQFIELKNYCDEYDFRLYVVDKDGKRKQIDPETLQKK